jgi:hypothetical protein
VAVHVSSASSQNPVNVPDTESWILDDDARTLRARKLLGPVVAGYVIIVWALIAWAMIRPDHTVAIMVVIMADVIVAPFLSLAPFLGGTRVRTLIRRVLASDNRGLNARRLLYPVGLGYLAIVLSVIAWLIVRADHTNQIVAVLFAVLVAPATSLLRR